MNFNEMLSAVNQTVSAGTSAMNAIQGVTPPALPAPNAASSGDPSSAATYGKAGIGVAGVIAGYMILRYFRLIPKII